MATKKVNKTPEKDKIQVVRINPIDDELEEVFLYREDPYVNEVKRVLIGTYKVGSFTEETIQKKEEG